VKCTISSCLIFYKYDSIQNTLRNIFILLYILPALASGQSAKFYADTTRLRSFVGHSQSEFDRALKMEWIIKGQVLHWGSPAIDVSPTETGVDTIFFKHHDEAKWDTMICKIKGGSLITFVYNTCCDYFDVVDTSGDRLEGKVSFVLKGTKPRRKKYMGSIDGSGVFMTKQPDTLSPFFRSPMLPNRYNVEVKEVKNCSGKDCQEAAVRKPDGSVDESYHYRIIESILVLHYLPVSADPIAVSYDLSSEKVLVK